MDLVTFAMNLYSQGIDPKLDLSRMREIIATSGVLHRDRHASAPCLRRRARVHGVLGQPQDAIRKCLAKHDADPAKAWGRWRICRSIRATSDGATKVIRINSQSGKGVLHVLERDLRITLPRWLQIQISRAWSRPPRRATGRRGLTRQHPRVVRCDVRGRTRCLAAWRIRRAQDRRRRAHAGHARRRHAPDRPRSRHGGRVGGCAGHEPGRHQHHRRSVRRDGAGRRNRRARDGLPARGREARERRWSSTASAWPSRRTPRAPCSRRCSPRPRA